MGRKKIPNAIRKNFLIPMSKEKEVQEFINGLQREAIAKTESEKIINSKKECLHINTTSVFGWDECSDCGAKLN